MRGTSRPPLLLVVGLVGLTAGWQAIASREVHGQAANPSAAWPQWGGPQRNFIVETKGLADKWPESGPPVLWTRPLGTGHSAIVADDNRLFTMYRVGNGRARQGPWEAEEAVIALDAKTGQTIWEHKYASRREDFSFGAGPHSTPLVIGDRLFTIGTNKQMFAFDKKSGKILWKNRGPGSGSAAVVYADGRLYFRYENGVMALIEANPDSYQEKGNFKIPNVSHPSWAHPVVLGGRLYLREWDQLYCYRIDGKGA